MGIPLNSRVDALNFNADGRSGSTTYSIGVFADKNSGRVTGLIGKFKKKESINFVSEKIFVPDNFDRKQ